MRALVQRVSDARVEVDGGVVGKIESGLVVLVAVAAGDSGSDADYLADKIINLRIFSDADGKMNLSLIDTGGAMLVVSQFTLYGDVRRGRRPAYTEAAEPEKAKLLYTYFVDRLKRAGVKVETGVFQAHMQVNLTNDGPVTIIVDSPIVDSPKVDSRKADSRRQ